ncbi:alpha/beta fold hydrolase [Rhodococcus rhodochrous]|uniref:alpha/beta fold hydrolase n=1 Tax=Rhodococcus rhodochrous TaxID=1829 RepID=UPI000E749A38
MTTPSTLSVSVAARYLEIDGAMAFVEDSLVGDETVLCLHTAGQNGVQWRHTTHALAAQGYRVLVPDLPGHGRSEPALNGPIDDLSAYAEWCLRLVEALGCEVHYVVGCSIGGRITLDIATRLGKNLRGIVAMAADAGGDPHGHTSWVRELEDSAAPSRTDRTYYGTFAVIGKSLTADRSELIATMHRREDPLVSTSDLIGWGKHDLRARLANIACPAHLVVGEDDLWLDPTAVEWAADQIPNARYTLLEGIGHYPMEEIDDFPVVLGGWLRELAQAHRSVSR